MAKFALDGYDKIVIYDPSSLADPVVIEEFSSFGGIDRNEDYFIAGDGTKRVKEREHSAVIDIVDQDNIYKLERHRDADTPVNMVAIGAERVAQWYEDSIPNIIPLPGQSGRRVMRRLRLFNALKDPDIAQNINLLWYLGWKDDDSDGLADGYSTFGSPDSTSFSSDEQSVTESTSAAAGIKKTLDFPLENVELTLSVRVTKIHANADNSIQLHALDSAGSNLGSNSETVTSTGRSETKLTTPANTAQVFVEPININNATASDDMKVKFPAVTITGLNERVNY